MRSRNCAIFLFINRIDPEEQQHKLQFKVHARRFDLFDFIQVCHHGDDLYDDLAGHNHCGWGFDTDQVWAMRWKWLDWTDCLSTGEHMLIG